MGVCYYAGLIAGTSMEVSQDRELTAQELAARVAELGPWFYPFDLGHGVRTE